MKRENKGREKMGRKERKMEKKKRIFGIAACGVLALIGAIMLLTSGVYAQPDGPDSAISVSNETKTAISPYMFNISGGYISTLNLTALTQNTRWKAFIGNVSGRFTLDDSSGSTIYDWDLTSVSGEVYATRNSSTISWAGIGCANSTELGDENTALNHTSPEDNLTATFGTTTHAAFFVGSTQIAQDTCFSLNTYVNDAAQASFFDEVALADSSGSLVYATVMEEDQAGYNGDLYDFQMIVPEIGTPGFSGATAYYLYVELS